ncbi:MAG: Uma2 family endonuclease [Thermomicrobiales bacterium]
MATTARLKTYDDLCRMPDDGNRYELIGGEIVVSPAPTWMHQLTSGVLYQWLDGFVKPRRLGWVAYAPLDVHLGPHDIIQPDIIYVSRERASILISNGTHGVPDLVVEILSPSTRQRDLGEKLALYARAGGLEYWMADPPARRFFPFALTSDGYQPIPLEGTVFRSRVLPGFDFDVEAHFAGLDAPFNP